MQILVYGLVSVFQRMINLPAAVFAIVLLVGPFCSKASATSLSPYGPGGAANAIVQVGSTIEIGIDAGNYADLYAWQFDLSWNPSILSLKSITEGGALQSAGSTYFVPGIIDNAAGTATENVDTLLGALSGASSVNGTLADFQFLAVGTGTSALTIENSLLLDSNLNLIPADIMEGSVTVTVAATPTVTPEPSSFLLLGTGLLLLAASWLCNKDCRFYLRSGVRMFSVLLPVALGLCLSHSTALGQSCMTIANTDGEPGLFTVTVPNDFSQNVSIPFNTSKSFDLSNLSVGSSYQVIFQADGGFAAYTISLNSDFVFSDGSNQESGYTISFFGPVTYSFKRIASKRCEALTITAGSLPNGEPEKAYSHRFSVTGGVPPYNWTATYSSSNPNYSRSGVPPGFTLDASSGTLSGSGQSSDLYSLNITVADSVQHTASRDFSLLINCSDTDTKDTDGDGFLDCWETNGVYNSQGIFIDFPGMKASPTRKDVFVYYDWLDDSQGTNQDSNELNHMHTHDPIEYLSRVVAAFDKAPVDDGQGIFLHLKRGTGIPETASNMNLGVSLPYCIGYQWGAFDTVKSTYAPYALTMSSIFHYALFAHRLGTLCGQRTGVARSSPFVEANQDFIVSLGDTAINAGHQYGISMAGTFMHELGHNLGLHHGGFVRGIIPHDDTIFKPNYLSVMNYWFQEKGLIETQDGVRIRDVVDYARVSFPSIKSLDESDLDETAGIGEGASSSNTVYGTKWSCTNGSDGTLDASKNTDWNCNGYGQDTRVSALLTNGPGGGPVNIQNLPGPLDDWSNLVYTGGGIGSLGVADNTRPAETDGSAEITSDQAAAIQHSWPVSCSADLNGDGIVDQQDLDFVRSHLGARYGDPNYDSNADFDHNLVIDVKDLAAVARQLGCKSQ